MTTRMLIDARHREETRVAVVKGNQIEEFDFESAEHQQLKGNIYLAKVTRVEPSLQAAFVDYGGNRHGFLAFSEIHPDYYQIPREDRERLIAEEQAAAEEEARAREAEEDAGDMSSAPYDDGHDDDLDHDDDELVEVDSDNSIDTIDVTEGEMPEGDDQDDNDDTDAAEQDEGEGDNGNADESGENDDSEGEDRGRGRRGRGRRGRTGKGGQGGGRSAAKQSDSARAKRIALRRRYKIQDVIHRRQVMLVQVVKEERGNKGAALTTYLSLAGRYCVLMPNTSHGGGISRKISSAADRKKLKTIVAELQLPATMGCIIRTAGLQRTKTEIKRDFDYLARLWDDIREQTLRGAAPMLVHTDSDLIKRAIRDIYNRDIEEVIVEGEDGYKLAKDFMKLLMPSHARRVKQYADPVPLFQRYGAEDQLSAMYHPVVQLKSGGYIVINPTEALVSIDINSGRSTKEHGIEQTALSTNMEAAREIARQLRLRDMAGLVVIDFIDMENYSNIRKVERAMKDALKNDRARIQVGKISSFGLMEMSRQRLRTGVLEASTRECPHCEGTGLVRTASSSALSALRLIEEEAAKGKGNLITLAASQEAAIYVLNNKRTELAEIEGRYGVTIDVAPNADRQGAKMEASSSGPKPQKRVTYAVIADDDRQAEDIDDTDEQDDGEEREERQERRPAREASDGSDEDGKGRRKRRRRGRRGGRGRRPDDQGERQESPDGEGNDQGDREDAPQPVSADADDAADTPAEDAPPATEEAPVAAAEDKPKRKPSRRARKSVDEADAIEAKADDAPAAADAPAVEDAAAEEKPKRRRSRAKKTDEAVTAEATSSKPASTEGNGDEAKAEKPKRRRTKKAETAGTDEATADAAAEPPAAKAAGARKPAAKAAEKAAAAAPATSDAANDGKTESDGSPRRGWWQRTFGE